MLWFSSRPASRSPFQDDAAVKAAWEKLQRATDLLEAERAVFRDERMAMRELEADVKRRETKLEEMEGKITDQEKRMRALPPPAISTSPFSKPPIPVAVPAGGTATPLRALSRAPFEMARSLLGRKD